MAKAPLPSNENFRLQDLFGYEIMDTPDEEDFDDIVRLASNICNTPISLISLVDTNRQWFKARVGLDAKQTSRDISFCAHAILNGDIFVVPDASKDERFFDNPLVTGDPDIRFYAGVPLVSPRGGSLGTLCVIDRVPRDLTEDSGKALIVLGKQVVKLMELRRMNAALTVISFQERQQRERLELVSERQKKMISIIAHDMRSPLSSLKSLLQLLPEDKEGLALSMPLLEMAGNQVNATLSLLDNIVDWGLLELNSGDNLPNDLVLQEIVGQVLEELQVQADLKGLTLVNGVDPSISLVADENKIRFILRNLLTNAIKFTPSGMISVEGRLTRNTVRFTVRDTAIGMPPAVVQQLFQGGMKSSRKGTLNEAGSGLGLSLVKEFIEKMNGCISVETEIGKGSSFAVSLPLRS